MYVQEKVKSGKEPNSSGLVVPVRDASTLVKGQSKPTRDVPASIALARIYNAVNPILQAGQVRDIQDKAGQTSTAARYVGVTDWSKDDQIERKAAALIATAGVDKHPSAPVDIVEKPAVLIANVVQDVGVKKRAGQELSPGKSGAIPAEATGVFISGVHGGQQSKGREWSVVNRSPSKKNSSGL